MLGLFSYGLVMVKQQGHVLILLLCFLGLAGLMLEQAWRLAYLEKRMSQAFVQSTVSCSSKAT